MFKIQRNLFYIQAVVRIVFLNKTTNNVVGTQMFRIFTLRGAGWHAI